MTTHHESNADSTLGRSLKDNLATLHTREDVIQSINERRGHGTAGSNIAQEVNSGDTKEIHVDLSVEGHQCIMMGSIRMVARGKVFSTNTMQEWSLAGDDALDLGGDTMIHPPFGMLSAQFATVDVSVGTSTSTLRSHMPLSRASQGSHCAYSWVQRYFTVPFRRGHPHEGHIDAALIEDYHSGPKHSIRSSENEFEVIETLAHPLNQPINTMATQDFTDTDGLKTLPPGCSLRLILTCGNFPARMQIRVNPPLFVRFTAFHLVYTVVGLMNPEIPRQHLTYPTLDVQIESHPLPLGQRVVFVSVTRLDTELIPQWVVAFVAPHNAFNPANMGRYGPRVTQAAIEQYTCLIQGMQNPYFQSTTPDGSIKFSDVDELNSVRGRWLGKSGRQLLAVPDNQLSPADLHLTMDASALNQQQPVHSCILICTDLNTQMNRDSCGGVNTSRLDLEVHYTEEAANQLNRLYVVKFQKFDITLETSGLGRGYEFSETLTKPSYTVFK